MLNTVLVLSLIHISPEDIDSEAPLFGDDGLGLDSIDALEIILILEKMCIRDRTDVRNMER